MNWGLGVTGTCPQLELAFMLVLKDSYKEEYGNDNKLTFNTLQITKNYEVCQYKVDENLEQWEVEGV